MTNIVRFNPRPYTFGCHNPEFMNARDTTLAGLAYKEASLSEARGALAAALDYLQTRGDSEEILAELKEEINKRSDPSSYWFQHIKSGDLCKEIEYLLFEIHNA